MTLKGNLIGVDPGKTSGIHICDSTGKSLSWAQLSLEEMMEFTTDYDEPVALVVVEDFITFKKRALQQAGSRQHASQVIGMMKVFAKMKGAKFILQPAEKKIEGEKLSGVRPSSDHSQSHYIDAYNHLFYRMHEMGLVQSVLEKKVLG